jgi:hypothetical protein
MTNWLEKLKDKGAGAVPIEGESLESVLLDLARYGRPRLGQYGSDGDWHCSIEVTVSPVGAQFEVRSEFKNLKTPLAAASQCRDRLRAALKALGGVA